MHNNFNKLDLTIDSYAHQAGDVAVIAESFRHHADRLPVQPSRLNDIIGALPADELDLFLSVAERVNFSDNEKVYNCGDVFTHLYFPLTAVFSQFQILEDGRTCESALIGSEGCLGTPGILNSYLSANSWMETAVGGSALRINLSIFNRRFGRGSYLFAKLLETVDSHLRKLAQRIICSTFHSVSERFCSRLLALQKQSSSNMFAATHDGIARALGTQRPSVSVVAKHFQRENVISYSRGKIRIVNYQKLRDSACRCE